MLSFDPHAEQDWVEPLSSTSSNVAPRAIAVAVDKNHAGDPNPWKKLPVNSNPFLPAIRPEGSPLGGNGEVSRSNS